MKKIVFVASLTLVVSVLALGFGHAQPAPKPAKVYKIKMQSIYVPGSLPSRVCDVQFVQDVEKMSGGRIDIEVFPPGTLCPSPEILNALGKGMFEASMTAGAYYGGILPEAYLDFGMPGCPAEFADWMRFLREEGFMGVLQEGYASRNVRFICNFPDGAQGNIISKKPIRTLADLKGLKMRVTGVDAIWMTKLGVSQVALPLEELYSAMAMGTIDALQYAGPAVHWDLKLMEVAKYHMYPSWLGPQRAGNLLWNLDHWKALPDDLKRIIELAAYDTAYRYYMTYTIENDKAIERMKKQYGVQVTTIPVAERAKVLPVQEQVWKEVAAKGPRAAKGIEILGKLMEQLRARPPR